MCPFQASLLNESQVQAVLLDIEGTTTPADFVYQILFPYARSHLELFLRQYWHERCVSEDVQGLRAEAEFDAKRGLKPPGWNDSSIESTLRSACLYAQCLMDQDRKSTALKALQGKIWKEGYRSGALHGAVYDDVPAALSHWQEREIKVAIFSSGSVLAQRLLFETTLHGNLTPFIAEYFDTITGPKLEPESYRRIAAALSVPLWKMLFISDTVGELDAAIEAGIQTVLCVRPGRSEPGAGKHPVIHSFDEVMV